MSAYSELSNDQFSSDLPSGSSTPKSRRGKRYRKRRTRHHGTDRSVLGRAGPSSGSSVCTLCRDEPRTPLVAPHPDIQQVKGRFRLMQLLQIYLRQKMGNSANKEKGLLDEEPYKNLDKEIKEERKKSTTSKQKSMEMELLGNGGTKDYSSITPEDHSDVGSNGSSAAHCHDLQRLTPAVDKSTRNRLILASVLCLIFTIAEIIGGAIAGSLAIMTDASHMLTDFASFMISLFSLYMASKPATKKMSFGWHRAEVMGAMVSVLLIWILTGVLVYMAILRVIHMDYEIDAKIMLITAGIGVGINILLGMTLHPHAHSHGGGSHGHSHGPLAPPPPQHADVESPLSDGYDAQSTSELVPHSKENGHGHSHGNGGHGHSNHGSSDGGPSHGDKSDKSHGHGHGGGENLNIRAAFVHVIGDLCQSVGVLIAAYIIYYKPEWKIVDPICTFVFSILVLITTITVLRDALNVLMEATPRHMNFNVIKSKFLEIPGVQKVHNLRVWSLTTHKLALSVHLAINLDHTEYEIVLRDATEIVNELGIHEPTIQIEALHVDMSDCERCMDPVSD